MGIIVSVVIRILVYALIAFLMYLMLDGEKKIAAFVVNIIGLFAYNCISAGFYNVFANIITSTIVGILFGFIGTYMYGKFDSLNKYLGTTVLFELITVLVISGIIMLFKIIFI